MPAGKGLENLHFVVITDIYQIPSWSLPGVLAALANLAGEILKILNCSRNLVFSASFTCSKPCSCCICLQCSHQNLLAFSFFASMAAFRVATLFAHFSLFAQGIYNLSIVSVAACSSPCMFLITILRFLAVWWRRSSSNMSCSALCLIAPGQHESSHGMWTVRFTFLMMPPLLTK